MRVYVAAAFEEKDHAVPEIYGWLQDEGHTITHDWTKEDDAGKTGDALNKYHAKCAREDLDGVMHAQAVVFLPHDHGKGSYCELGMALALGIPVVVWKYKEKLTDCIFLKHPDIAAVVDSEKDVIDALAQIENENNYACVG